MADENWEHASSPLKTVYGESTFHCFSFGPHEEDNVLCIEVAPREGTPLTRVQSACYTAEIFRSTDCDCHEQLDESLRRIHAEGGIFVYMLADGRGAGLLTKTRALSMFAADGIDTHDAYERLGIPVDPRRYSRVGTVLKSLGVESIRLMTNNPRKLEGLEDAGLAVSHEPLRIPPTDDSAPYLATKRDKFGHLL